jgi:uncharacterized damage-inducible protein DinB
MTSSLPSPLTASADPAEAFVAYLDFYRGAARDKVTGLDAEALHSSRLPSGWTPVEMISHLLHMERRWLVWGFLGEAVGDPWGDHVDGDPSGPWVADRTIDDLLAALAAGGRRTSEIVSTHVVLDRAATGGRFPAGEVAPTLGAILFHVMQEYARHVGHLDIVRELADGATGES